MRVAWVTIASVGCLSAKVVPCGDLICPASSICVDGILCATQPELDACRGAGLADGATCRAPPAGDGYCSHGACVPDVCGDNIIEGNEVCDGQLVTKTCQDLNYYYGSTACTAQCALDLSGCSGRCGDTIVQADQGEDCDGAPPAFDCTDVGYDFGALACHACTADSIHSCSRFGWRKVGASDFSDQLAGDAGMYALYRASASRIEIHEPAATTLHPIVGRLVAIDARSGDVLITTGGTVERYHAGAWSSLGGLPPSTTIVEATIALDGTAFVLAAGCAIGSYTAGAWTFVTGPAGCSHLAAVAANSYAVVAADGSVRWTWPGCSATSGDPCECGRAYSVGIGASAFAIVPLGTAALAAYSHSNSVNDVFYDIVPQCGGGPSSTPLGTLTQSGPKLVVGGSTLYASSLGSFGFTVSRATGRVESFPGAPSVTGEPADLWATRDGFVYAESDGGLYRLEALSTTTRLGPPEGIALASVNGLPASQIALALDGTFVTCGAHVYESTSSSAAFQQVGALTCAAPHLPLCCVALFAPSAGSIYAVMSPGAGPELDHWNGSTWTQQSLGAIPIGEVDWLAGNATTVVGVLPTGEVIVEHGGAWISLGTIPTCTAKVAAVDGAGRITAAGTCGAPAGATILTYDANLKQWTPVYTDATKAPFTSISVTTDGTVFAAVGQRVVIGSGATWTAYDGAGAIVSAVTPTDAWAVNVLAMNRVVHWDGARWTPVAFPAAFYFAIAAGPGDVAVYGQQTEAQPTPVWHALLRAP
jgi:hypothetical protein